MQNDHAYINSQEITSSVCPYYDSTHPFATDSVNDLFMFFTFLTLIILSVMSSLVGIILFGLNSNRFHFYGACGIGIVLAVLSVVVFFYT